MMYDDVVGVGSSGVVGGGRSGVVVGSNGVVDVGGIEVVFLAFAFVVIIFSVIVDVWNARVVLVTHEVVVKIKTRSTILVHISTDAS